MTTLIPKFDIKDGGSTPTGAINRSINEKLQEIVSVKDFGATGDGVTDDTTACQNAVNYLSTTGGTLYFPQGTYLLTGSAGLDSIVTGIHVPFTGAGISASGLGVTLVGDGNKSILKANSANMIVVRWSASNGGINNLAIQGNSTSSGLVLCSSNTTASTPSNSITYNNFSGLTIEGCGSDGIRLQCPLGADNGVYYNNFSDSYIFYNISPTGTIGGRGIYLYTFTGATGGQNRNSFKNINFQRLNTGIEIQDGDTNTFYACNFEDISKGTVPNATPTAVIVGAGVVSSASNRFFGLTAEACTQDLTNANAYSEFYGCLLGITGNMVLTVNPMVWMGGYDGSVQPTLFPGWRRNMSSIGVNVNGTTLSANSINLGVGTSNVNSSTIGGTLGSINANGNTKALNINFISPLAITEPCTVILEVSFTGFFANWNATGLAKIVSSFCVDSSKTSSTNSDTYLIAAGAIGTAGVVVRSGATFSTTKFTSTYTFTAASGANPSPVNYVINAYVLSNGYTNTAPFTLSWT